MALLQRLMLVVVIATCLKSLEEAQAASATPEEGTDDGEDEEFAADDEQDEEDFDDDEEEEDETELEVDVREDKSKRGTCQTWTTICNKYHLKSVVRKDAKTVAACRAACINDAKCNSIDFDDQLKKCSLNGPWSGERKDVRLQKNPLVFFHIHIPVLAIPVNRKFIMFPTEHQDLDRSCLSNAHTETCEPWTTFCNMRWESGLVVKDADTVPDCKEACIDNAKCTAAEFLRDEKPRRHCFLVGPWTGKNKEILFNAEHHKLNRKCVSRTNTEPVEDAAEITVDIPAGGSGIVISPIGGAGTGAGGAESGGAAAVDKSDSSGSAHTGAGGTQYVGPAVAYPDEDKEEESGGSGSTILIVVMIIIVLAAVGVTVYAYQKKILCFEKPAEDGDEDAGTSPLLDKTASASKLSPSRATTASGTTIDQPRPSATTVSGND